MNYKLQNISHIVSNDLCCGCGVCEPFCPQNLIKMTRTTAGFFAPKINAEYCSNCGICASVCPGQGLNLREFAKQSNAQYFNNLIGGYRAVYVGYANDLAIRQNASSGGLCTAIIRFMFEQKLIDGAVVTVMDDNPLFAKAKIVISVEELLDSTGSKYTPVSMHEVLREIIARDSHRLAFVGLPCHLEAIELAKKVWPTLADVVVFKIGLYCNNTPSVNATKYLLGCLGISEEEVASLRYRGKGWPGYFTVKLKDGSELSTPMTKYIKSGFLQYFCRERCLLCADQTSELADISLADPWGLYPWTINSTPDSRLGESVVIARTITGSKILQSALDASIISLTGISVDKAIQSSSVFKKRTKRFTGSRLLFKQTSPKFEYPLPITLPLLRDFIFFRFNSFFAKNTKRWRILRFNVKVMLATESLLSYLKKKTGKLIDR